MIRSAMAGLVILGCCVWGASRSMADEAPRAAGQSAAQGKTPTLAVLDFVDRGPSIELAALRTALAEMLVGDLSQYEGLRVVERVRVAPLLGEADLKAIQEQPASAEKAARALSATHLLSGTYEGRDDRITLAVTLTEVSWKTSAQKWTRSMDADKLFELERELSQWVLTALALDPAKRRAPPPPKPGPSPTVAVMDLRNLSAQPRLDPMQSGFAEILQSRLAALPAVRLVEREKLQEALKEQKLSLAGLVKQDTLVQVGRLVGAERLVYGSFCEIAGALRIDLRLADAQSAVVLSSQSAAGPREQFSSLLTDLALRLAADLATPASPNAAGALNASARTGGFEAALHLAAGAQFFQQGRAADALAAYERVLLLEPQNLQAIQGCLRGYFAERQYDRLIQAAENMIAKGTFPKTWNEQNLFYDWLFQAFSGTGKLDQFAALGRTVQARYPQSQLAVRFRYGSLRAKGRDAMVAQLEETLERARASGDATAHKTALWALYYFYYEEKVRVTASTEFRARNHHDREYWRGVSELTRESARRANELYPEILKLGRGRRGDPWDTFALLALQSTNPYYFDASGQLQPSLSPQEWEPRLMEGLEVFAWDPLAARRGYEQLADCRMKQENYAGAIEAYRWLLQHTEVSWSGAVPNRWDQEGLQRTSPLDRKLDLEQRIAELYRSKLNRGEEAAREYQRLIEEYGYAHFRVVDAARALTALGQAFPPPRQRSALIWGGGDAAYLAYAKLLEPQGFHVDRAVLNHLGGGHLAPYDLVVLVRAGKLPYTPDDVLALRGFVATGGSLLVVVSPGGESAQPGLLSPLLGMFGIQPQGEMIVRAASTHIAAHPITQGISAAMAKTAIHLQSPHDAALIRCGERTVLAALPYRHGRVVAAAFGQWFVPNPDYSLSTSEAPIGHLSATVPVSNRPQESGANVQIPLLTKVLAWLAEPHVEPGRLPAPRKTHVEAQFAVFQRQFGIITAKEADRIMQQRVAAAPAGDWKEESLWAAGEASLQLSFAVNSGREDPFVGWPTAAPPPPPAPEHYRRLIELFPNSELKPHAQWRLAECQRCQWIYDRKTHLIEASMLSKGLSLYEQVQAPPGSVPWTWAQLRMGQLCRRAGDVPQALKYFLSVAEHTDRGAEKGLAVLAVADCYRQLNDHPQAERWCKLALETPNVHWNDIRVSAYSDWGAPGSQGGLQFGDTRKIVRNQLDRLGSPKLAGKSSAQMKPAAAAAAKPTPSLSAMPQAEAKQAAAAPRPASAPEPVASVGARPELAIAAFDAPQARLYQEAWAQYLAVPVEATNSVGMRLVLIPPGEFRMGSPPEAIAWCISYVERKYSMGGSCPTDLRAKFEAEGPLRRVSIAKPFYMGTYEVTRAEYAAGMGREPPAAGRLPAEGVAWREAVEFCRRLSAMPGEKAAGRTYRLPSEAEWEYACRAGSEANYAGYDTWYANSSKGPDGRPVAHPVGEKASNFWGLHDMRGNVAEWCANSVTADRFVQACMEAGDAATARVFRGGSYGDSSLSCRAAWRDSAPPDMAFPPIVGSVRPGIGFRVCLDGVAPPRPYYRDKTVP